MPLVAGTPNTGQGAYATQFETEQISMLIYPNPTAGLVNVQLNGFDGDQVFLTVHDQLGRIVLTEQMETGQLAATIHLDKVGLGAGIYFVTADFDGEKITQRLVITR